MSQLTSKERVKAYLDFSGSGEDSLIDVLIELVSARVSDYCDRKFEQESGRVEYPVGGTNILQMKLFPITSIASIHEDSERAFGASTLVDSSEYYSAGDAKERGLIIREASWKRELTGSYHNTWLPGIDIIKVTYTGGYAVSSGVTGVPNDLQRVIAQQCAYLYNRRNALGINSVSGGEGSQSFTGDYEFLPEVKRGLQKYRRLTTS
tara:strand:+ start:3379 stop:3999 length:621 start_codon:yes stop_codon:yes gene_type:complete